MTVKEPAVPEVAAAARLATAAANRLTAPTSNTASSRVRPTTLTTPGETCEGTLQQGHRELGKYHRPRAPLAGDRTRRQDLRRAGRAHDRLVQHLREAQPRLARRRLRSSAAPTRCRCCSCSRCSRIAATGDAPGTIAEPPIAAGVFLAIDLVFWHHSIDDVGAGLATVLANIQVVLVPLVAWLVAARAPGSAACWWRCRSTLFGVLLISGVLEHGAYGSNPRAGAAYGVAPVSPTSACCCCCAAAASICAVRPGRCST